MDDKNAEDESNTTKDNAESENEHLMVKALEEHQAEVEEKTVGAQNFTEDDIDLGSLRRYDRSNLMYGEEYEGEGAYYVPPQILDLDVKDSLEEVEKSDEFDQDLNEDEVSEFTQELEEQIEELDEVEEEEDMRKTPSPTRSEHIRRLPTESIFETLVLQPKEKTVSEIKFEMDHRDLVQEEMKKLMQRTEERVTEKRKPLEKHKISLAEVDVSGLYPQPKVIESEVSFGFDETEDMAKEIGICETETDLVQYIMNMLKESSKDDPESIFTKKETTAIKHVQKALEETVSLITRGTAVNIPKRINEVLPDLKENLRNIAIHMLSRKLVKYEKIAEVEEKEQEVKKEVTQPKSAKKQLSAAARRHIAPEKQYEKPRKEEVIQAPKLEAQKQELPPAEKIIVPKKIILEKLPEPLEYEKIDWELFLTESEKMIAADPELKPELEKYIEQRKKDLLLAKRMEERLMEREERYKSTDPEIMLEKVNLHVTMKFILNSGEKFTCAYRYFMTFKEIKEDLSGIFKVPPDILIIYRDDIEVKDEQTAHDLEPRIEPFDCVTFRLLTLDNDRWRLKSSHLELPVPDIITCTVETGQDYRGVSEYKEVVVEIEQRQIKKPFVGGYRDICTGVEYHNAFSQSAPREPTLPHDKKVSTDTQTAEFRSKCVDTTCNKFTQMSRSDHYVSTEFDKILTPKPYVDYETWLKQRDLEAKVLLIQKYVRAMIVRKFVKKMAEEYQARKMWEEEQERKRTVDREIRLRQSIINMVYPKTKADFEALYAMVERWRKAQIERIGMLKTEAPRKAELCAVLEKEIKLLEAIEVHRIAINKEQQKRKELDFMAKVSKPITWTGYRGMTIQMDTLKTQRARELRELYLALLRDDLNYQDRIELLISLKHALRVNCTRLTDELINLLNRECELLIRGVSAKKLEYLRRRINHLFLKYFKEPEFNPEVAKYDPEYNHEPLKNNVLFCKMCHQMKVYKNFGVNARDTNCNVCQSCRSTYNIAVPRTDLNPYRYILKCVRKDEQKRNCYSSCAFILQDEDMRFLVENIWHSRSAVSENDNLMDLRMPRWDRNKDWTPWNSILLTEAEAKAHLRTDPSVNYDEQLLGEIVSKHQLAKRHFQQMFSTEERMRDSGKWANVVNVKNYLPPPITADIWDLTESECERIKRKGALYEVHETRRKEDNYVQYI